MRLRYSESISVLPLALLAVAAMSTSPARAQEERPARVAGHPNLNGVWQAVNTANWNLEGQAMEAIEDSWQLGAIFAVPPGQSAVEGGTIPYLPAGLEQRKRNKAGWPAADPEAKCFRAGIPRQTYLPYPFEIVQGGEDILFVYEYATSNRVVRMNEHVSPNEVLVDQYLGWSNGRWEGDTLVIEVFGLQPNWLDRAGNFYDSGATVVERYTPMGQDHLWYEATIEDPSTFSRPWTVSMPLYRRIEPNAEIFEYKCIEIAEPLLYGDLLADPID